MKSGQNDKGYIKSCVKQYRKLITKHTTEHVQEIYNLLKEKKLLEEHTATKKEILATAGDAQVEEQNLYEHNEIKYIYTKFINGTTTIYQYYTIVQIKYQDTKIYIFL